MKDLVISLSNMYEEKRIVSISNPNSDRITIYYFLKMMEVLFPDTIKHILKFLTNYKFIHTLHKLRNNSFAHYLEKTKIESVNLNIKDLQELINFTSCLLG
jgi:hypothetical protein